MRAERVVVIPAGGLAALGVDARADVVRAVWWASRPMRAAIHRQTRVDVCDVVLRAGTVVFGAAGPAIGAQHGTGLLATGECPCRDHLLDMLVGVDRFLAGHPATNPAGAARRHVRTRLAGDWIRARRASTGAQTRTDRIRAGRRARMLPDEFHRALLESLVDEAGSPAPLEGEQQLVERLADRAEAEFGGTRAERLDRVRAAFPAVRDAARSGPLCTSADGRRLTWWDRYIDEPLGRRPRRSDVSLSDGGPDAVEPACFPASATIDDEPDDGTDDDGPDGGGGPVSRRPGQDAVLHALSGLPRDGDLPARVRSAVRELAGRGVLRSDVADGFLADPARVEIVAGLLRATPAPVPAPRTPGPDRIVAPGRAGDR